MDKILKTAYIIYFFDTRLLKHRSRKILRINYRDKAKIHHVTISNEEPKSNEQHRFVAINV